MIYKDPFVILLAVSLSAHLGVLNFSSAVVSPVYAVDTHDSSLEIQIVEESVTAIEPEKEQEVVLLAQESPVIVPEIVPVKNIKPKPKPAEVLNNSQQGAVVDAQPIMKANAAPTYPRVARQRGWEGIVTLEVSINVSGLVDGIQVKQTSGHAVLDAAALAAVRRWHFTPARRGQQILKSTVVVPVHFKLIDL